MDASSEAQKNLSEGEWRNGESAQYNAAKRSMMIPKISWHKKRRTKQKCVMLSIPYKNVIEVDTFAHIFSS